MEKVAGAVERRPYLVLLCVLLVSGFMVYGVTKVSTTTSFEEFLPQDYPSVKVMSELEDKFGGGSLSFETILLKADNVTKADIIKAILELENTLRTDPDLEGYATQVVAYIDYVIPYIENYESLPDHQLEASVQYVLAQPGVESRVAEFLAAGQKATLIKVSLNTELSNDKLSEMTDVLHNRVDEFDGKYEDLTTGITGQLTIQKDTQGTMGRDTSTLIPAAMILVILILFLVFRRFSDIFMPFLTIAVGAMWVIGLLGFLGMQFTMIHVALIPLILGIGIAYSIHVLNRYYEERGRGLGVEKAVVKSVKTIGVAVSLSAITTMIGFGSFLISDLPPLREFGVFAALGVFFTFILAVTFLPALLIIRDRRKASEVKALVARRGKRVDKALSAAAIGAEHHRRPIIFGVVCITAVCVFLAFGVSTTMSLETFMPSDIESVVTANEIEGYFGGQSFIFVLAKGDNVTSPQGLQTMIGLENSILSDESNLQSGLITSSMSLAEMVLLATNGAMPQTENEVIAALGILRGTYPTQMQGLLTEDNETTVILFSVIAKTDKDMRDAARIVRSHVEEFRGGALDMTVDGAPAVSGEPVIFSDIMGNLAPSMIKTTILAILLCLIVLCVIFRSIFMGAIALMPMVLILGWELGTLRILGWPLDVMTMGISALIIGIGIDLSIHMTYRFREEWKEHKRSPQQAIRTTVMNVGTALLAAAGTTMGVFAVLSLARMPMLGRFGTLTALVIFYALIAALFILPSILVAYALRRGKKLSGGAAGI